MPDEPEVTPRGATFDPLLFWGRLPLATTLWLRDRLRANRAVTAPSDRTVRDDQ